ncbi:hypothetical protein J1605_016107 [Eschrichtius robustus]|uniref:Uncharacterized protein n=1 Tax=Eschrichtius robustus TaxID=9764 RepID=A0AB34GA44_ESCRO|nr:hypothetical protein J1605_016107 [Eschrichtius robustus]
MGPRDDVPGAPVRGSPGRQPRWAATRDGRGGLLGAGLPVPGRAWERASAPGSRPPLRASQPAAAGPRTVGTGESSGAREGSREGGETPRPLQHEVQRKRAHIEELWNVRIHLGGG